MNLLSTDAILAHSTRSPGIPMWTKDLVGDQSRFEFIGRSCGRVRYRDDSHDSRGKSKIEVVTNWGTQ